MTNQGGSPYYKQVKFFGEEVKYIIENQKQKLT
jgi:hypothetical protein